MRIILLSALVLTLGAVAVMADAKTSEQINWLSVGSSGEVAGTSANYILGVSVGQAAVGPGTSTHYQVNAGFLQNFGPAWAHCCIGDMVGNVDASADGVVTMGDLTRLIDYLFISLIPPDCMEEANVDLSADHLVTMGDMTVLIDYLYISYNPLPPCP
jgi:hypothetical protein